MIYYIDHELVIYYVYYVYVIYDVIGVRIKELSYLAPYCVNIGCEGLKTLRKQLKKHKIEFASGNEKLAVIILSHAGNK